MSPTSSSSSSVLEEGGDGTHPHPQPTDTTPKRPRLHSRKSSGTIIVPREHPRVELKEGDEVFDEDDARAMSPRRSSQDLEKMSEDAKVQLDEHAKILQKSLLEIFNRIEAVKEEHDKLDSNNKFLQKYIGDLMSTSKITATGAAGGRKK
ncbi:related to bZIP transcription factor [Rhynchosporium agropyri]|uniref:Related to bZIP transcription factor n=3 Tax=Rhynchosporium TaxID=38037 RepID=A0A1E1MLD0_RHYSE|nr:related to bZIP transcription factor [Rhynchosporium agropyri]CZT08405.1 related to bZIP transcription factor [Rhynchosporium commune]CZT49903.1 related to bZIP transcription factor [Rhynchosporium secalis]